MSSPPGNDAGVCIKFGAVAGVSYSHLSTAPPPPTPLTLALRGSRLLRPTGLAELRQFVANAARDGLRVRAIGRPHSDNQNFCEPGAALVLMDRYLDGGFTIQWVIRESERASERVVP